jgi:hypothetical protein
MSEDQLSRADKMRIRRAVQVAKDWQAANPEAPDVLDMGRALANLLRVELPDVNAVEMGRVCLNLAEFLDAMLDEPDAPQCPAIMAASNHIKAAGFDLTSIEWEESP